jgi:hypothetical protein
MLEQEAQIWMALSVTSAASVCVLASAELAVGTQHTVQSRMCSQMSTTHESAPLLKFPENDASYNNDMRCKAAVDTGTSLITGPSESIAKLQELMGQVTNCEDLSNLPTITFVIDGMSYPLTPSQYVLQVQTGLGLLFIVVVVFFFFFFLLKYFCGHFISFFDIVVSLTQTNQIN